MKKILLSLLVLPLVACHSTQQPPPPVGDPIGVPFLISVQALPANTDGSALLRAKVRFGGFGSGPADVKFTNGTEILGSTSERVPTGDPANQEFMYNVTFKPVPNKTYQIRAVATWTYGAGGSIISDPVSYP